MIRVFIAEDSKLVCERLIEMISEIKTIEIMGHAQDAYEAKESILRLNPDIVILDIRMFRGNGIQILKAIRKANFKQTVIILTNYPYPQYRKKCKELGADYFFDKSKEFEKVIEVCRKFINHSDHIRY